MTVVCKVPDYLSFPATFRSPHPLSSNSASGSCWSVFQSRGSPKKRTVQWLLYIVALILETPSYASPGRTPWQDSGKRSDLKWTDRWAWGVFDILQREKNWFAVITFQTPKDSKGAVLRISIPFHHWYRWNQNSKSPVKSDPHPAKVWDSSLTYYQMSVGGSPNQERMPPRSLQLRFVKVWHHKTEDATRGSWPY